MELKSTKMQELDEQGWKDYFYIGTNRTSESIEGSEWLEFKKDRLEQYTNMPEEYKIDEYLLTFNGKAFGWLTFRLGREKLSFIFGANEIITDDIFKALLTKLIEYITNDAKAAAFFWSSNSFVNEKLKKSGAELIEETEDGSCQFSLTKEFLLNNIA